jgi:Family of unknown function (DUF5634) N-terminal domain/PilZ domain
MADFDQYSQHFPVGLKVSVGIPVPGGKIFTDWALINELDEDLLIIQLSRDYLPEGVKLSVGTIMDIRGGQEGNAYSCRAIIVTEGFAREIVLRLIGEIVSDELREFYRIDAFLPIKYFISTLQSEVKHKIEWNERRTARAVAEQEKRLKEKKPWERLRPPPEALIPEQDQNGDLDTDELNDESSHEPEDTEDHTWDDVIPLAANISGGGLRMLMHHQFAEGQLVPVEIYLPSEPHAKIIDTVCEAVFSRENHAASKDYHRQIFNTGLQFKFIDERDRDAIVSYISNVQLKRIRLLREKYLLRGSYNSENAETGQLGLQTMLGKLVLTILFIIIFAVIVRYYYHYATDPNRPKNEIEGTFEEQIRKIINRYK